MMLDAQSPELQATFALVEAFLASEMESHKIPGLSLAIIYDQDLVWAKGLGYANLARGVPATAQTLYRVASITKLFTATLLMQLRDAGKLHLDEPLERYAPAVKLPAHASDGSAVTFRQVVAHLAGLPRDTTASVEQDEEKKVTHAKSGKLVFTREEV